EKDATVSAGFAGTDAANKVFNKKEDFLAAIREATGADAKEVSMEGGNLEFTAFADLNSNLNFSLHVGADSSMDNKIDIDVSMMSARGLKVNGLRVDGEDDTNATAAIDTIAEAIQQVSTQRSALGAVQNRLEHTINNLDNVVENTTAAEAQIRDTDMATEMVKFSNNNILAQAGQAMLAQANQSNQGVLSLLG
ncbi:MAG: flagellin, partial [Clostridium sp.]|nr:flagellin [Clostridium sp.]